MQKSGANAVHFIQKQALELYRFAVNLQCFYDTNTPRRRFVHGLQSDNILTGTLYPLPQQQAACITPVA